MTARFVEKIDGATVLDINDLTAYWLLDSSEFPLPEVVYEWVENSEGKRLADWHLGGRTIKLRVMVKGSSESDAYSKVNALLEVLLDYQVLEVKPWGSSSSVFYKTMPALPVFPDFGKKFVIDAGYVTNITVEIPVEARVYGSAVTLTVLEALGVNDSFEQESIWAWTETQPAGDVNQEWFFCASDSDGSFLMVGASNGRLYISDDGGVTWAETQPYDDREWDWLAGAVDSDGTHLVAAANGLGLFISDDGGATWTDSYPVGEALASWACVDTDDDGSFIIAGIHEGRLYTSDDGGSTWDERQPAGAVNCWWHSCACDSDGSNLIAADEGGRLYTSSNSGVNWTERQPGGAADKDWECVASDADGSVLMAGITTGRLYLSVNSGVNWSEVQPAGDVNKPWNSCACDSDGTNLIAVAAFDRVYVSTDTGASWSETQPAGDANKWWRCCASDANGSNLMAGVYNGRLYIGTYSPTNGWTATETNAGTVTIADNVALDGTYSCELETTAGGTDVAAITDSDYITVDADKHYQVQVFVNETDGTANCEVDLLCYSDADALLDTLELVEDYNPATSDAWIEACEVGGAGVVNPVGGDAPAFPTGTAKVKRVVRNNAAVASVLAVDRLWFGCMEYIPGYKLSGAVGIVIPPEDTEGIMPAPMDVRFDAVYDRPTEIFLGQRDAYSGDFDPVQEPGGATEVLDYTRRSQNYFTLAGLTNLLDNPDLETITGGSGNTTDWANWAETRSGISGAVLQTQTTYYHAGTKAAQAGRSSAGKCDERLLSDFIAVDANEAHIMQLWTRRTGSKGFQLKTSLVVYFYDVANTQIGYKVLWAGYPSSTWQKVVGYVYPDDMPAGTTQVKIRLRCYGTTKILGGYHIWDDMLFGEVEPEYIEASFPLEAHHGLAFITGGFSFAGSDAYDELTSHSFIRTLADQEITPHIALETVDIGDANTDFQESLLYERLKLSLPSHSVSEGADLSYLEQVIRFAADPLNAQDFWYDHIGLVFYDRAYTELSNVLEANCIILDSRSSKSVLASLDGTLNTATVLDHQSWKSPPSFEVDPAGLNLTLIALKETDGDYELTPVVDIEFVYNPVNLLVGD